MLLHEHRFLEQREGDWPIKNSAAITRLPHSKTTRKYRQSRTTVTKNWECSMVWHVTCVHTWPSVTSLRLNVHLLLPKSLSFRVLLVCNISCVEQLNMFALHSTCAVDFVCHYFYELLKLLVNCYIYLCVVLVQTPNSQNIPKMELWTCDNNEVTHSLIKK